MILIGNQRGGGRDLALHLLKEENDHVRVHQLRGFVASDLEGAFKEAYAISRGTRCTQFLFSLSLNPPPGAEVSTEAFESAIERTEAKLGLTGQPRAIVFHEKEGRRHAHAVWSRIKVDEMKAVQLSHSTLKLMDVSREGERYKATSKELKKDREQFAAEARRHVPTPKRTPEQPQPDRAPPKTPLQVRSPDTLSKEFTQQAAPSSEILDREQRREAFKAQRRSVKPARSRGLEPER